MGGIRKQFSKEFKASVALAAIIGDKTIAEICAENNVHSSQVNKWKKVLKQGAAELFIKGSSKTDEGQTALAEDLYKSIGRLKVENDWLKKKLNC